MQGMSKSTLITLLHRINKIKVTVIGDACLDVYWWADMQRSELSRETAHYNLPVVRETLSPGAAGNVAVNAASLGCTSVQLVSVIGQDWRGQALKNALHVHGVKTDWIVEVPDMLTSAYIKAIRMGYSGIASEDPRLDFAPLSPLRFDIEQDLSDALKQAAKSSDVICVSDQLANGCITEKIRQVLKDIAATGLPVLVDSRDRIQMFDQLIVKPNALEGWRAITGNKNKSFPKSPLISDYESIARQLADQNQASVCLTLGPDGCIWADTGSDPQFIYHPALREEGVIDIVGAGDAFLAALGSDLAAHAKPHEALGLASLVSNITIHKLKTTGSATPAEIKSRYLELAKLADPYLRNLTDEV